MKLTRLQNEAGAILVFSLFIIVILITLSAAMVFRSVFEASATLRETRNTKIFYLTEAGTQSGLNGIDTLINNYMLNTVSNTSPPTVVSKAQNYAQAGKALRFLCWALKNGGTSIFTCPLDADPNPTSLVYTQNSTAIGAGSTSSGTYTYTITFTEKSAPVTVTPDTWDFPFNYRIKAAGTYNNRNDNLVLVGDFTVRVQRDNFAKYALFTNSQTAPDGTRVWFTSNTDFSGPLHTNDRFNFYGNPGGNFDGATTQVQTTARFYNSNNSILLDNDHNSTIDVPTFSGSFTRNKAAVTLSSAVLQDDVKDQATAGNSYGSNGIYVPSSSGALTGGIYVRGSSNITMSVDGGGNAVYSITQGSTTKNITVNRTTNQTTVQTVSGTTTTYNGKPDGVDGAGTIIYADGAVNALSGTVQKDTEVTVSGTSDIVINNNIRYQEYNSASGTPGTAGYTPPSADGYKNLLGIVSWGGNVRVGNSAPDNIEIHASVLAQSGVFTVDNYDDTGEGSRGKATLLGGTITDDYGPFGQFNSSTGVHIAGYGRNFVYDNRMQTGSAPPYFPSLNTFVAFTNDITDKKVFQDTDT